MNRKTKWLAAGIAAFVLLAAAGILIWQRTHKETEAPTNKNLVMYVPFGENSHVMVDQDTGGVFCVTMPEDIYDTDGSRITKADLKKGDLLTIYGDGIMLESYPGQYPGVTKIEVTKRGEPSDADQYQDIIDQIYQEPDPSERPWLSIEYATDAMKVSTYITEGSFQWTYPDENGQNQTASADLGFILGWENIVDMTLDPEKGTDLTLYFSAEPESITVERWASELRESYQDVPESESVNVTKGSEGYVIKDVRSGYVYRITGTWENGTVEYGFLTK